MDKIRIMDKIGTLIILISTILLIAIVASYVWWLPEKWQACGKLHDNNFAQIMCFMGE